MAIWFDNGSRYIQSVWSSAKVPPLAVAFWYCTDYADQVVWKAFAQVDSDNSDFMRIGIDSSNKPYLEVSKYVAFPTPGLKTGKATSTYAISRNEWFHVFALWYTYSDRTIWVNGANSGNNLTTVALTAQVQHNLGADANSNTGPSSPLKEAYPTMADPSTGAFTREFYARGYIADFAIWQGSGTPSTQAQVAQMYRSPMPHRCFYKGNLIHYLPFYNSPHLIDLVGQADWSTAPNLISREIGWLRLAGQPADGDKFTIDGQQYRYKDTLAAAFDIKIGANAQTTRTYTERAIMDSGTPGTEYGTGTTAHTSCWAGFTELGNNKDDPIEVLSIITGPVTRNVSIDVNTSGNLFFEDIDGNSITTLDRPTVLLPKRGPSWWDNTGSPDDAVGATNHGHNPPLALGYPMATAF